MVNTAYELEDKFYKKIGLRWILCHVRGYVDECVVFRRWSKRHQTWVYVAEEEKWVTYSFGIGLYRGR